MDDSEALHIVLVGDSKVGKSALISACHIQNPVLDDNGISVYRREHESTMKTYTPTLLKSYRTKFRLFGHLPMPRSKKREFLTHIIEVGGSKRYDNVRPLAYMDCNVFLVCFDLTNIASFDEVKSKWLPEIKHYEPQTPVILVGTKSDLKKERQVMAGHELHKLSKTLAVDSYIEISCYNPCNDAEVLFSTAVELAYDHKEKKTRELKQEQEGEPAVEFDINELDTLSDQPEFTKKGSTTLSGNWQDTLNNNMLTDVLLKFPGNSPYIHAHKFVLSLASEAFKKILRDSTGMFPKHDQQEPSNNFMNSDSYFCCKVDGNKLEVTFDTSIDYKALVCILTWMYTGQLDIPDKLDDSFVESLYHVVEKLEIHPLIELCKQLNENKEKARDLQQKEIRALTSKHETLQNDGNLTSLQESKGNEKSNQDEPTNKSTAENARLEAIIAYKEMWSKADKLLDKDGCPTDTVLIVKDKPISVHRIVMVTRSPMVAAMLEGGFKEKDSVEIKLPGISLKHFHTILEFMYTDKCLLNEANIPGVLELANRFCIQSLIDRCEEFLIATFSTYDYSTLALHGKEQVKKIMKSIYLAKTFNASFLHKWCLHFVATNYTFFERQKDFARIWSENEEYMERNKWPSRRCSQSLKEYKKSRQNKCCVM